MNQTFAVPMPAAPLSSYFPLLQLLNPRQFTRGVLLSLGLGLFLAWFSIRFLGWPLWSATAVVLITLLPIGVRKWQDDRLRYGPTVMLLSILLTAQGVHTIEHLVQWAQYHVLYWTMRQSTGLLSPANAEWVHFVWNWSVFIVVLLLIRGGMRNGLMYMLLGVAFFHGIEHTYTMVRYQLVLRELHALGVYDVSAQGLPGICGRDGWLARSALTQGTFLRSLPGITTAVRLDVHFWWNVIEMVFLIGGGHWFLRHQANLADTK